MRMEDRGPSNRRAEQINAACIVRPAKNIMAPERGKGPGTAGRDDPRGRLARQVRTGAETVPIKGPTDQYDISGNNERCGAISDEPCRSDLGKRQNPRRQRSSRGRAINQGEAQAQSLNTGV